VVGPGRRFRDGAAAFTDDIEADFDIRNQPVVVVHDDGFQRQG
jgi:hypothetical protein